MSYDSLDARRLRRRVGLERKASTRDPAGGESYSFVRYATVYAETKHKAGREAVLGQQMEPLVTFEFLIRYRSDMALTDRVVWKEQVYEIIDIAEVGRNVALKITAKRPGGAATGDA